MKKLFCSMLLILGFNATAIANDNVSFSVKFPESIGGEQDGRLMLMLANNDRNEPRFQINPGAKGQIIFGKDVSNWQPGTTQNIDNAVLGYPFDSLKDVPAGDYYVQAIINRYKDFNLSNGKTVSLPPEMGEGQKWNRKPGNFYSKPMKVNISEDGVHNIEIVMDQEIAPIIPPKDTKYIKYVKMKSEKLSEFWGEDVILGANVLLPEGFDEHPDAKYPLMIFHGHFPYDFGGFSETPPDPDMKPTYSARFDWDGYNVYQAQAAHDFYKKWISKNFPRFIIIEIQHATPYYDDSYAVNSANQGPYGDALTYELIPYVEKMFRGIGEGWSRFTYGGSTGGWEALAVQVFYPDQYNGAFAACPDPIDFRAYTSLNIYEDKNAYYYDSDFSKKPRPGQRDYLGNIGYTLADDNRLEAVVGSKTRSGRQYDIWEATFSPMGEDGYPVRLWDKMTGEIDHKVADYWRENYDLRHIMERDWATIGPKLEGKINIYVGDMDNYYLNNAVYLTEEFLENTKAPYYNGDVDYGDRAEHCWNGDHNNPNGVTRLNYNFMYVDKIIKRIEETAPAGADLTSWRY
ncbi:MAG: alpha/beta hydrolase-fold protein [Emcibacteraceae bacterium]|nr:alpha/beta hydrolase-fold protein [Emcibacteraceae bacterium]